MFFEIVNLWKKIEQGPLRSVPSKLTDDDVCHFAREYHRGKGYEAGEGNHLVFNFKIEPTNANYAQRKKWKIKAAQQFADELAAFLPEKACVCHVPTSKTKSDPEYDPRFDLMFAWLTRLRPDLRIEAPFVVSKSHQSVHTGGERSVAKFYSYLRWKGFSRVSSRLYVVDDVITSGAHFKACEKLLREEAPDVAARGVFWAVTVDDSDLDDLI